MKNFRLVQFLLLLLVILPLHAKEQQSHTELRQAILAFLSAQTQTFPGQVTFKVDEIDRRVTLAVCPAPEIFLPPGTQLLGNAMVGARCPGKKGWSLFVPVQVKVAVNLLVLNKPLLQGQVLRAEDLSSQRGELTHAGLLTDPQQAIGKVLKFGVSAGQMLKQDMLRAPYAITQGQAVQIHVEGPGYRISSAGVALNNAAEGQSVQVKPLSGQVLSGTARVDGIVEVRP
jgi:flagella basal body P-ring formation protein FlgA